MSDSGPEGEPDRLDGVPLPEQQTHIVGHEAARATLTARLDASRLPGGILLHGPPGIGKATLAFVAARQILAATGDEGAARVDEQVAAGAHPNLYVLRRQPRDTGKGYYTVIRVEEIRALRDRLHHTRGRAGHRIAIIDAIDDCNPAAANALLKTLEEPPAETMFLLVSHRPGQLLPTIRSRCHALALRPLSAAEVRAVLAANRPELDAATLDRAVALAGGRPRRGFEALLLSDDSVLGALKAWLGAPASGPAAIHFRLADTLAADPGGAEVAFARDMLTDWLAAEARDAATAGPRARPRLASVNALWDKANALFAEADSLNLDVRQTLIVILDAIRKHVLTTFPELTEPR